MSITVVYRKYSSSSSPLSTLLLWIYRSIPFTTWRKMVLSQCFTNNAEVVSGNDWTKAYSVNSGSLYILKQMVNRVPDGPVYNKEFFKKIKSCRPVLLRATTPCWSHTDPLTCPSLPGTYAAFSPTYTLFSYYYRNEQLLQIPLLNYSIVILLLGLLLFLIGSWDKCTPCSRNVSAKWPAAGAQMALISVLC